MSKQQVEFELTHLYGANLLLQVQKTCTAFFAAQCEITVRSISQHLYDNLNENLRQKISFVRLKTRVHRCLYKLSENQLLRRAEEKTEYDTIIYKYYQNA